MTHDHLPQTGFILEKVYANTQHLEVRRPVDGVDDQGSFVFGWDWSIVGDDTFEVMVKVSCEPTPQRFEQVRVVISGRFRIGAQTTSVGFEEFVRIQAVAILMPYAREAVSSLTARGFYGAIILPPLNVVRLMQDKDPSLTAGARQMAEGRVLRFASDAGTAETRKALPRQKAASKRGKAKAGT